MRWLLLVLLMFVRPLQAFEPGMELPVIEVGKPGELHLEQDSIRFAPWRSAAVQSKVHVIQYMAARLSAKSINEPFTDRLKDSGIPLEHYHMTTVVNLDDAMMGTRGMVLAELEQNKKRFYRSSIVADADGVGLAAWGLRPRSSAIIILGADGRVQFFRDGALSATEIEQAMQLVQAAAGEQGAAE
jgi:uncharacterized protein